MAGNNVRGRVHNFAQNGFEMPIFKILLGVLLIFFFVLALMMDLQTSEAYLLNGGHVNVTSLNWGILLQPYDLFMGHMKPDEGKAALWAWGTTLIYLVCVVGEATVHGCLGGVFKTGAAIIVIWDFWTNVNYGTLPSGLGGQIGFALMCSFIIAFFGFLGIRLILKGLAEWTM